MADFWNGGARFFRCENKTDGTKMNFYMVHRPNRIATTELSLPDNGIQTFKNIDYDKNVASMFGTFVLADNTQSYNVPYINSEYSNQFTSEGVYMYPAFLQALYSQLGIGCDMGWVDYYFRNYVKGATQNFTSYDEWYILDENGERTNHTLYIKVAYSTNNSVGARMFSQSYSLNTPYELPATTVDHLNEWNIQWAIDYTNQYTYRLPMLCGENQVSFITLSPREYGSGGSGNSKVKSGRAVTDGYVQQRFIDTQHFELRQRDTDPYIGFSTMNTSGNPNTIYVRGVYDIVNLPDEESAPYEPMGTDTFYDTYGTYDFSSDAIGVSAPYTDNIFSSDFIKVYNLTAGQLQSFHDYLFSDNFLEQIKKTFNSPIDGVLSLLSIPVLVNGTSDTIKIGNCNSGVSALKVSPRYVIVDCGNIASPFENSYGMSQDLEKECELYLPFLNFIRLNICDVYRGAINVSYTFDVMTGDFLCTVKSTINNSAGQPVDAIIYQSLGNASLQYPVTSSGYNALGVANSSAGIALGVAGLATGGAGLIMGTGALLSSTQGILESYKHQISYAGGLSGNWGIQARRTPYVKVTCPNIRPPQNYQGIMGYPANYTDNIGSFNGFSIFTNVNLSGLNATDAEKSQIKTHLENGVYVTSTSFSTSSYNANDIVLLKNTSDDMTIGKSLTYVETITGTHKDVVNVERLNIRISTQQDITNFNYVYVKNLDRFYFVRQKQIIKEGIYDLTLEVDVLQTYANGLRSLSAYCNRSANQYNPYIKDPYAPRLTWDIVYYRTFQPSAMESDRSTILVTI